MCVAWVGTVRVGEPVKFVKAVGSIICVWVVGGVDGVGSVGGLGGTGNDAISIDAVSEETQRETQPESEGAATADEEESTGVTVEIPDSVSENGHNAAPAPGIVAPTLIA